MILLGMAHHPRFVHISLISTSEVQFMTELEWNLIPLNSILTHIC